MPFYFRKECPLNSGYLTDMVKKMVFETLKTMYSNNKKET
ncbi:hypothetical protein [Escherichia coli]